MATAEALMNLGTPAEQATRMGDIVVNVTTTANTQNSAGGLLKGAGNKIVLVNTAALDGAVTLPADAGIGDRIEIYNSGVSAQPARVFPPTGGTLNQGTPNQFVVVVHNASLYAVRATAINWRVMPAGTVTPA